IPILENHKKNFWIKKKKKELLEVIRSASGLWIEAIAENYFYSPGSKINITTGIVNRSDFPFELKKINITHLKNDSLYNSPLIKGKMLSKNFSINLHKDIDLSKHNWLRDETINLIINIIVKIIYDKINE